MHRLFAVLSIALLSSCSRTSSSSTPPVLGLPRPGVTLIATPDRGPACGAVNFRVHFDWGVSSARPSSQYELHVNSPTGDLLASGPHNGTADTGDWVRAGQWFFLLDADNHEVIAAVRIGPDDCG